MIKLKRYYSTPDARGQRYPVGWETEDRRFSITYKKLDGSPGWWHLQDHSGNGRRLTTSQKEHDTLRDAREMIEMILEDEKDQDINLS